MTEADRELVLIERHETVLHLVMNRAEVANALNYELLAALEHSILEHGSGSDDVRGLVLSGAGDRFSAGADLDALAGDVSDVGYDDAVASVGQAMAASPLPIVAAIERYAFGAAVDLAWSCDAVVIAADARVAVPATQLGLLYNPDSLAGLHARIGDRAWRRLVLMGDELDGETAFALGMGESLASSGGAVKEALRLAATAARGTADAVAATKSFGRAINAGSAGAAEWQIVRRELLAGADRRNAIANRKTDRLGQ